MPRRLRLEADGGSRGNPGVAGYGALLRDADSGDLLVELAAPLGTASNNVAEYRGLIAGLEAAQRIGADVEVEAALDSKLVVEQMSGRWKIKHADMRALALEARKLADAIVAAGGSVRYSWVPRADNADADALSNRAMDGETIERWHVATEEGGADPDELEPTSDAQQLPLRPPPHPGEPTRIVLVRHGVTRLTEEGRLDGRGGVDPDLTETGHEQARSAAAAVAALVGESEATVISSSLARARQTAAHVGAALGAEVETDAEWDEQSFGTWDGEAVGDLVARDAEAFRALRDDAAYAPPGGESHDDLTARVLPAWEAVVARGGTVVVVCHRKPILVVLAHVLGLAHDRIWRLAGAPGSLTAIEAWPDGHAVVAFTNRT
ncbi:bifunctional RNase H/acid phosphatase [Marihabitans asiaticum]|uniref:Putative phosphoglycerate mutase n=1 Tax=Marihabitans asiaticum TaxID=415218 RepID=A0A560WAG1_9MICO|nr:bifunctional RNase H/acid phosphatase [Marihabitans asiaticum]TWD14618.1 putative phosphoglycerate mutase [Marihabitans asiaticum]